MLKINYNGNSLRSIYFAHFSHGRGQQPRQKTARHNINELIRAKECRLIANDNQMVGVKTIKEALVMAEEAGLDLVEIAPQAKPPVCKIIDYGKFLYEQQKREKQQKKLQHHTQLKEIRFKWRTDTHDFNFKTRHARKFIETGDKVKASVMFRGREIVHKEIGRELLVRFIDAMIDIAKVDQNLRAEGRIFSVVLSPDKDKISILKKLEDKKAKEEQKEENK